MSDSSFDCTSVLYDHNLLFFFGISGNGTGSIFWFCVPTCEDENHENMIEYQGKDITKPKEMTCNSPGTATVSTPEENRIGNALILVDSRSIRKFLLKGLQMHGYRVIDTENFSHALQEMKKYRFDLFFCDFMMPESDRVTYIKQYREWEQRHRTSQTVRSCNTSSVSRPY